MNHPPLLSVIVANYNNRQYLGECLDSILGQTYKDLEIIVSDDASTDDSPEIIRHYETRYPGIVKGIFSTRNKGVAQTRHNAILEARAGYITTLDSDDYYYDTHKLEKEMEIVALHKQKTGKDVMAYSNIAVVNKKKNLIRFGGNPDTIKEGMVFDEIISRSCMIPRDYIVKREAYLEAGGYDPRFPIYEDWDLKVRLAKKFEFYYTGINGTAYRRHGEGLSSPPIPKHIKWLKRVFKKNAGLVDKTSKKKVAKDFKEFLKTMKNNYRNRLRKKKGK